MEKQFNTKKFLTKLYELSGQKEGVKVTVKAVKRKQEIPKIEKHKIAI